MTDKIKQWGKVEKTFMDENRVKKQYTLSDWGREHTIFTPALFYWGTQLDRDLISDFTNQKGLKPYEHIQMLIMDDPLLSLTNPIVEIDGGDVIRRIDLSRTLYLCPKSVAESLDIYLAGFAIIDKKSNFFARPVKAHLMPVLDKIAIKQNKPVKCIDLLGYHLYTNKYCNIWQNDPSKPEILPIARRVLPTGTLIQENEDYQKEIR